MLQIVQTDADQPWITRQVADNGEEVWRSSENYLNPWDARRAIELLAEEFGFIADNWDQPRGPVATLTLRDPSNEAAYIEVDVLDERTSFGGRS